jgi:hypothetical protein
MTIQANRIKKVTGSPGGTALDASLLTHLELLGLLETD